jgi:hypothetical protein
MQNKKHKPVYRFKKDCDPLYWELWDKNHPGYIIKGDAHIQGISNTNKFPCCGSTELIPKFFGNFDVGIRLIYCCPCGKTETRIWTEGYEYEE